MSYILETTHVYVAVFVFVLCWMFVSILMLHRLSVCSFYLKFFNFYLFWNLNQEMTEVEHLRPSLLTSKYNAWMNLDIYLSFWIHVFNCKVLLKVNSYRITLLNGFLLQWWPIIEIFYCSYSQTNFLVS